MAMMFVRHEVKDFAQWKQVYDGVRAMQDQMGVRARAVYQAAGNPNDVTVTHEFDSLEAAQHFAASGELRSAMERAGVSAPPSVWFAERA